MAKKKAATYPIVVDVSPKGNFAYEVEGNPNVDATFLPIKNGESVSWLVRHGRRKSHVPFQVEFGVFNPLAKKTNTVIRSRGERTPPAVVNLDKSFGGNLIFKYTISTLNGWWQDPDIVPVPSDGFDHGRRVVTGIMPTRAINLSVGTDATGARIVVCSPNPKSLGPGLVLWQWDPNSPIDDFVLSFGGHDGYFPAGPINSVSQRVVLVFPKTTVTRQSDYQVVTRTEGLVGSGTLIITPGQGRKRAGRGRRARRS
jgi:hypothetical protein